MTSVAADVEAALAGLVGDAVDGTGVGLAVGTFGAIAEFLHVPDAPTGSGWACEDGGEHLARTVDGALRARSVAGLGVHAWRRPTGRGAGSTHAVAFCLPTERAAGPGRTVLTELGPDRAAIDPADADDVLVDLGLGVSHLEACVRTRDPVLLAAIRARTGRALDGGLSATLVAAGVARVFRTAIARIEVATPIPPPDGQSPPGPHTHLLPALLAHRRTHAATDPIPDGHVPVLTAFPPHPNHDPLGRPHPFDTGSDAAFEALLGRWGDPDEVRAGIEVRAAVLAGEPARTPPPTLSRAARRGWEVALRRLDAAGHRSPTLDAWRRSAGPGETDADLDAPVHEAHP